MILKISLGHEKLKTRKRTKMKCSVGYCSIPKKNQNEILSEILYISVSLNVDFRTLRPSDAIFSWTQDAGAADARRGRCGRKTRALWTQDAGRRSVKLFLGSTVSSPTLTHFTQIQTFLCSTLARKCPTNPARTGPLCCRT